MVNVEPLRQQHAAVMAALARAWLQAVTLPPGSPQASAAIKTVCHLHTEAVALRAQLPPPAPPPGPLYHYTRRSHLRRIVQDGAVPPSGLRGGSPRESWTRKACL